MRYRKTLLLLLLLLPPLTDCSGPAVYPQGDLADQILVARHGHDGKLTNQTCLKYDKGKCVDMHLIEYDLSDKAFRDNARRLQFFCKMGGREYKICPDRPGFCRTTYPDCNWLTSIFGCDKQVDYVPATPIAPLADAHLQCFSIAKYDWDEIN